MDRKILFFFLSFNEQQGDSGVFSSFFYPLSLSLSRFPSQWLSHCSWTMILMRSQLSLFHQSERKGQRKRSGVCVWGIAYFGLPIGTWRVEWRGPAWWLTRTKPTEPQSHPNNILWWYMVPSKHLRTRTKKKKLCIYRSKLSLTYIRTNFSRPSWPLDQDLFDGAWSFTNGRGQG